MSKTGKRTEFSMVRQETSRIVVSYGLKEVGNNLCEWNEVSFYKKHGNPDFQKVKKAIIDDINKQTDAKILNGYEWKILHGDDAGRTVKVWLSSENKENYKAKYDTAKDSPELIAWPIKFKVSENDNLTPVYEYFENIEELKTFYYGGLDYIERTVNYGWQYKDSIDWEPYKELFPKSENVNDQG